MSRKWVVAQMGCRAIEKSRKWDIAQLGYRAIEMSRRWDVALEKSRANGISPFEVLNAGFYCSVTLVGGKRQQDSSNYLSVFKLISMWFAGCRYLIGIHFSWYNFLGGL